jgi:hypothetical protein
MDQYSANLDSYPDGSNLFGFGDLILKYLVKDSRFKLVKTMYRKYQFINTICLKKYSSHDTIHSKQNDAQE